jgi:hypothetical protein
VRPHRRGSGRLTDRELRAHPEWHEFGAEAGRHPPMRRWLAVPLIGSARLGANYGVIQASDRLEGDFTEQDEANLVRLATLTSVWICRRARTTQPSPQVHSTGSVSANPPLHRAVRGQASCRREVTRHDVYALGLTH